MSHPRALLKLSQAQQAALDRVHASYRLAHPDRTIESMLFAEVFRSKAAQYRRMVSKFENDGSETRQVPESWGDPTSPKRDVTLRLEDVDWDSQRASKNVPEGAITIRLPGPVLDRLERGLALRQAWSKQYGPGAPVKIYANFAEWAVEQAQEFLQREISRIEDEEAEREEAEIYPELAKRAEPAPPPVPRPTIEPHRPATGINPHDPHRRRPWDR
jgi:hypothetical protein